VPEAHKIVFKIFLVFFWEPQAQDHCIKKKTEPEQTRARGETDFRVFSWVFMMVTQVTMTFCSELFKLLIGPSLISHDAYINSPSSFLSCIHHYLDRE
jgi:hypothetical protein